MCWCRSLWRGDASAAGTSWLSRALTMSYIAPGSSAGISTAVERPSSTALPTAGGTSRGTLNLMAPGGCQFPRDRP